MDLDAKQRQEFVGLESIDPGKDPYYRAALQRLKSLLQDEAELSRLSLALGKSSRYLSNVFSEGGNLPLSCVLQLSQLTGIPAEVFFENIGPKRIWLPEELLHRERERGTKVKQESAFLTGLAPRIERLKGAKVDPVVPGRRRTVLDPLEDERFRNRQGAMQQTEALVEDLTVECETRAAKGVLPGPRLGELSGAIALWATIQRTLGLRNLAINAFQLSFPLARLSQDSWSNGTNHQRAAHVFHDLGRPDLALELLAEALWHYDTIDDSTDRWRCFVDRGVFLDRLPDPSNAASSFHVALAHLSEQEWRFRAGAFQGLAYLAHSSHRLDDAVLFAKRGIAECREVDNILAFLKWRLAATLFDLGKSLDAKEAFRESLSLVGKFGSAGDIALVALDYAEVLLRSGQHSEFTVLVAEVTRWLPSLRANTVLHRAMSNLLDLSRLGQLSLVEIQKTRAKVESLFLQPKSYSAAQPPTCTIGPNSGSSPG